MELIPTDGVNPYGMELILRMELIFFENGVDFLRKWEIMRLQIVVSK